MPSLALRGRQRKLGTVRMPVRPALVAREGEALAAASVSHLTDPSALAARAAATNASHASPRASFPILIFCNNRAALLESTLTSLFKVRGVVRERVVASQDGPNEAVRQMLDRWGVHHWQHTKVGINAKGKRKEGAALIADHYKWAIERAFAYFGGDHDDNNEQRQQPKATHLIIAEDDMLFAPDFMDYFVTLSPLLESDRTLWTISAFHDNGFAGRVFDDTRVLRTEWTVGFGWLLRRQLWEDELRDVWPSTHWDHWLRDQKRRKGRETLFPEVSRNYHTGARGTHSEPGLFERYFRNIRMSEREAPRLMDGDVDALRATRYEGWLSELLRAAEPVRSLAQLEEMVEPPIGSLEAARANATAKPPLALLYDAVDEKDKAAWERLATYFGLWHTLPIRGAHRGLVLTGHRGRRLLLVPSWSPYAQQLRTGDDGSGATAPSLIGAAEFVRHGALGKLPRGWMSRVITPPAVANVLRSEVGGASGPALGELRQRASGQATLHARGSRAGEEPVLPSALAVGTAGGAPASRAPVTRVRPERMATRRSAAAGHTKAEDSFRAAAERDRRWTEGLGG
jgi:hypothetical protein